MHVREPARVREEMATQVEAGADVLLAPTWLTHRRALVPVGETRRAWEWTNLAIAVARDGAELGRERRRGGPVALILGVLPDSGAIDEAATGRVLAPNAAAERDERDQAGILAETGVVGVLIEARPSLERARTALRAVVETDLPAWVMVPGERADGLPLQAWLDALAADGATMLLLGSTSDEPSEARFGIVTPGPLSVPDPRGAATAWIEQGARVLGIAAGATPDSLLPLVEARDAAITAASEGVAMAQAELDSWARDAARRAAGGRALWIGDAPASLPQGFDWTVVPVSTVGSLPDGAWRLLVSPGQLEPRDGVRLVERGGIIAGSVDDPEALLALASAAGVRLDQVTPVHGGGGMTRFVGRRED